MNKYSAFDLMKRLEGLNKCLDAIKDSTEIHRFVKPAIVFTILKGFNIKLKKETGMKLEENKLVVYNKKQKEIFESLFKK